MHIAIIGAGNVGGALAKGWAAAGHRVTLGVRHPDSDDVKDVLAEQPGVRVASVADATLDADVIVVSTPTAAVVEVAKEIRASAEAVIIDATNAVGKAPDPYPNGAEALRAITKSAHVVKCFNTTGFENMRHPRYGDTGLDMFVAGASSTAKATARPLALDLGFAECYDLGGDDKIALLEGLALVWINLAIFQKQGRDIAFKVIRRPR